MTVVDTIFFCLLLQICFPRKDIVVYFKHLLGYMISLRHLWSLESP